MYFIANWKMFGGLSTLNSLNKVIKFLRIFKRSNSTKIIYSDLFIPSGFSPNGDGINEFWQIVGIDKYPNTNVYIYNRLGVKVFSSNNYKNDWNGFFNGVKVPDGTYFYELILGPNMIKKGYVYVKGN